MSFSPFYATQNQQQQHNIIPLLTFCCIFLHSFSLFPPGNAPSDNGFSSPLLWKMRHPPYPQPKTGSVLRKGDNLHRRRAALQLDVQRAREGLQQHRRGRILGARWPADGGRWVAFIFSYRFFFPARSYAKHVDAFSYLFVCLHLGSNSEFFFL